MLHFFHPLTLIAFKICLLFPEVPFTQKHCCTLIVKQFKRNTKSRKIYLTWLCKIIGACGCDYSLPLFKLTRNNEGFNWNTLKCFTIRTRPGSLSDSRSQQAHRCGWQNISLLWGIEWVAIKHQWKLPWRKHPCQKLMFSFRLPTCNLIAVGSHNFIIMYNNSSCSAYQVGISKFHDMMF